MTIFALDEDGLPYRTLIIESSQHIEMFKIIVYMKKNILRIMTIIV